MTTHPEFLPTRPPRPRPRRGARTTTTAPTCSTPGRPRPRCSPLVLAGGLGSYVWDFDGRRYLDFSSQLVNTNIGHQHPKVTAAIAEQAARLTTIAPQYANEARGEAAARLAALAPDGFSKVFFTNGGADANENAIRMARLHTGRDKVLSFYRSYHGNTGAAITSTGDPRRWPNEYATGHVHFFGPYLYRSSFWAATEAEEMRAGAAAPGAGHPVRGTGHDRGDPDRVDRRHRRGAGAAARLPGRGQGAVRQVRHRVDRRRGHVRLRPGRRVVRVQPARRGGP